MSEQIKICLLAMDNRTRQFLSLVLQHQGNNAITLIDEDEADIAVLDLDYESSLETYQALRERRPAIRSIGLSARFDQEYGDILALRKPISANNLLLAIQKIAGMEAKSIKSPPADLGQTASSTAEDIRRSRQAASASRHDEDFFNPEDGILGSLLTTFRVAKKRDVVAAINFPGGWIILVNTISGIVKTNLTSSRTDSLAILEKDIDENRNAYGVTKHPEVEYVTRVEAFSRYRGITNSVPEETFLWQLGAMTSRGRLPIGIKADERVYLRRWPNLTRIPHSDEEIRVIAYWIQQSCSPREIADVLGIPKQDVFRVYTAAFAAGLAEKAHREVDGILAAPDVAEHQERGLLSSILKRLLQRKPSASEAEERQA